MNPELMKNAPLLDCRALSKSYGGMYVLNGLDLKIFRGRTVGLLGPNGSGKTTLLKLAAGLLTPTCGEILVDGMPVGRQTKAIVSYLPERTYFDGSMRVSDTLRYFTDFYSDFDCDKARGMIGRLNVPLEARFRTLSKGTKEKLQLCLVMSRRASLYLLDEPLGGVDPAARDFILDMIFGERRPDATILLSTHLIYDIERVLDDIVMIAGGGIYLADSCDNIRRKTGKSINDLFREVFRC